jgi:DNA ligase-associated metallophosphoesterase
MPDSISIQFAGEDLVLLADRAIHWPARRSLLLADVHLGKDASFRAAGMPVPVGNSTKDLARIQTLLAFTNATRLVILGDLVHARASHQTELATAFTRWRTAHRQLEILLIGGNHDRRAGPPPADWHITQMPEPFDDAPLLLGHKPRSEDAPDSASKPLLCGHVHPAVAVRDFDRSYATMPCFVVEETQLIFPAFGSFTGGYKVRPEPTRRIFAVAGKSVVEVKG